MVVAKASDVAEEVEYDDKATFESGPDKDQDTVSTEECYRLRGAPPSAFSASGEKSSSRARKGQDQVGADALIFFNIAYTIRKLHRAR